MENRFDSVPIDDTQRYVISVIKEYAETLAQGIEHSHMDGRCKALAQTKLEECVMFATKGISIRK